MPVSAPTKQKAKKKAAPPQFAKDIYDQLGGGGINGAIAYCGGRNVTYGSFNPQYPRIEPDQHGLFDFANCLRFKPNTKGNTLIIIGIQPLDTYTVWFWREVTDQPGVVGEILERQDEVYCDDLQQVVERMYDTYIKNHQEGWIDL